MLGVQDRQIGNYLRQDWVLNHRDFVELSFNEWAELTPSLQKIHPKYVEYAKQQAWQAHPLEDIDDAIYQFTRQIRFRALSLPEVIAIPCGFGYSPYRHHAEIIEGIVQTDAELASLRANFEEVAFEGRRDEACRLYEAIENRMDQYRTIKGPGC